VTGQGVQGVAATAGGHHRGDGVSVRQMIFSKICFMCPTTEKEVVARARLVNSPSPLGGGQHGVRITCKKHLTPLNALQKHAAGKVDKPRSYALITNHIVQSITK
jgi:hypothetical protein